MSKFIEKKFLRLFVGKKEIVVSIFRLDVHFHFPQQILDLIAGVTPRAEAAPAVSPTKEKPAKGKPTPVSEIKPPEEVKVDPPPPVSEFAVPAPDSSPAEAPAEVPIDEQIRELLADLAATKREAVVALLNEFGLKKASECPKTKKPELLARMKALV